MSEERGQATTETLLLSLILLVPLLWVLGVLSDLHRAALATTAAARDAGAHAARATDLLDARGAIDAAVAGAFQDHAVEAGDAEVVWRAVPAFERGARMEILVRYPVPITQAPFLGRVGGPSVWVTARHVVRLHPFISRS